jgi:hypothetical protein
MQQLVNNELQSSKRVMVVLLWNVLMTIKDSRLIIRDFDLNPYKEESTASTIKYDDQPIVI